MIRPRKRIVWLVFALAILCGTAAAAQVGGASSGLVINLGEFVSWSGFIVGAGALVAWGRQDAKVKGNGSRLTVIENDRVTRAEFSTLQDDIREIREILERRRYPREDA